MILQQNRPLNIQQTFKPNDAYNNSLRQKLLDSVRRQVRSQLEQSLHLAVPQYPCDSTQTDLTKRPCDIQLKINGSPTQQLEPTTHYLEAFEQSAGTLLILGLPGAGKTTTLLRLALELIAQSMSDRTRPIPVILNLATWHITPSLHPEPFLTWLLEQIRIQYPNLGELAQTWLESGELILLLDGLDQLSPSWQQHAIIEINQLLLDNPNPLQIAITSRLKEYKSCKTRLRVNGALWLQPLNDTQIRDYLYTAKSRELWQAIRTDSALLDIARTPLNLTLMALADEDILIHAWRRLESHQERQTYLIQAFIRRMLNRESSSPTAQPKTRSNPELIRRGLVHLAQWMQRRQTYEFQIEAIQAEDFLTASQQKHYYREIGLLMAVIFGSVVFAIATLAYNPRVGIFCALPIAVLYALLGHQSSRKKSSRNSTFESESRVSSPHQNAVSRLGHLLTQPWQSSLSPDQTIQQSVIWAIAIAPILAILGGLLAALGMTWIEPNLSKPVGIGIGLTVGLLLATPAAKMSLKHFWLRRWLSCLKIFPGNLIHFLDDATHRLFLKKMGRRYHFMHELLQQFFESEHS